MATVINRYALDHTPQLSGAKVFFKICELCGISFVTDRDEARFPGDYISLQRRAGKRSPIICSGCESGKTVISRLAYMKEEAQVMQSVVAEVRAKRERDSARLFSEEKLKYAQRCNPLRHQSDRRSGERKRRFAKWREPLMLAFRANEFLTARQIAAIMSAAGNGSYEQPQSAVYAARNAGLPIVKSEKTEDTFRRGRGKRYVSLYTLSSQPDPAPLTPPRDSETRQFMREVQ